MLTIKTNDLTPEALAAMPADHSDWVYNGLDCMITDEILDAIRADLDPTTQHTYEFSKSLQAPILEMNMRGVLVDQNARAAAIASLERDMVRLEAQLEELCRDGIGYDLGRDKKTGKLGWQSGPKVKELLYSVMGLPPVRKRNVKGQMAPTVDRDALEKLRHHFLAEPIINHMLALRDAGKQLGTLRTRIDSDNRIRTSYNIAGTNTGRLSSSLSDFGTGTNLQNIDPRLRRIFIADPGMKLANIDLEQGDSRNVGAIEWDLFGDGRYLDACESGDLHTTVSRMCWPHLGWTGDKTADRRIADQVFYREYSYRHMAKVLGHGTNYLGTPPTMALHTKLPVGVIREFQSVYFTAFPGHYQWHGWVTEQLIREGQITTLFGRRRFFFGRRTEQETIRAAVAYMGQSMTSDEINAGLLAVWRLDICQLLLQVHDSILIQYPEDREDEVLAKVMAALPQKVTLRGGREFVVPADCAVGWNWGYTEFDKSGNVTGNPDGLRKWKGNDSRKREQSPTTSLLHRRFH